MSYSARHNPTSSNMCNLKLYQDTGILYARCCTCDADSSNCSWLAGKSDTLCGKWVFGIDQLSKAVLYVRGDYTEMVFGGEYLSGSPRQEEYVHRGWARIHKLANLPQSCQFTVEIQRVVHSEQTRYPS